VSQPLWVDCTSVAEVGSSEQLARRASAGHHVVLRFPSLGPDEKLALIARLAEALPDHSVFDSGSRLGSAQITIIPVVSRARILERRVEILQAVAEYRQACLALIEQYRSGILSQDWRTDVHGGHCRFLNRRTGQVVEAPLREWVDPKRVDPYFFAKFVRTTSGFEPIAELLTHDYHDAARILDVVSDITVPVP
jgi:hypothetical protein